MGCKKNAAGQNSRRNKARALIRIDGSKAFLTHRDDRSGSLSGVDDALWADLFFPQIRYDYAPAVFWATSSRALTRRSCLAKVTFPATFLVDGRLCSRPLSSRALTRRNCMANITLILQFFSSTHRHIEHMR